MSGDKTALQSRYDELVGEPNLARIYENYRIENGYMNSDISPVRHHTDALVVDKGNIPFHHGPRHQTFPYCVGYVMTLLFCGHFRFHLMSLLGEGKHAD